jgi:peptidoglycan endopeptidase LytE
LEKTSRARLAFGIFASFCVFALFIGEASAQGRERVVKTVSSQPTNLPPKPINSTDTKSNQPVQSQQNIVKKPLLQNIIVVGQSETTPAANLVRKTASTSSANSLLFTKLAVNKMVYDPKTTDLIQKGIFSKLGIRYLYGASGPNRYDCSGFIWAVFGEAGINFERQSARSLWAMSEPVFGDERFKFGTLVFFNRLGHVGIVADENGFFHASSSKGITYSPFAGYWEKRIVGFRRLPSDKMIISNTNDLK